MEMNYADYMPKDVVKLIEEVETISPKTHNGRYEELHREFNSNYSEKRAYIKSMLDRVSLSYNLIAQPIAEKCNEKDLKNIKITDLRYVSVSSKQLGLIDGVFIDYEHFDGWQIKKGSIPMKGIEMKMEEKENESNKSVVWTEDKEIDEKKTDNLRSRAWAKMRKYKSEENEK